MEDVLVKDSWEVRNFDEGIEYLWKPWDLDGRRHGFLGCWTNSSSEFSLFARELSRRLSVSRVLRLQQVHGAGVLDLRNLDNFNALQQACDHGFPYPPELRADAAVVQSNGDRDIILGIVTADCVPVLIKARENFALIHAGWRGLAVGVIAEALRLLVTNSQEDKLEILIGPCAGHQHYEVGPEVIDAIGATAAYETRDGKFLLDLGQTARRQLAVRASIIKYIVQLPVCTISDSNFHSYRREGAGCGRNFSYIQL